MASISGGLRQLSRESPTSLHARRSLRPHCSIMVAMAARLACGANALPQRRCSARECPGGLRPTAPGGRSAATSKDCGKSSLKKRKLRDSPLLFDQRFTSKLLAESVTTGQMPANSVIQPHNTRARRCFARRSLTSRTISTAHPVAFVPMGTWMGEATFGEQSVVVAKSEMQEVSLLHLPRCNTFQTFAGECPAALQVDVKQSDVRR